MDLIMVSKLSVSYNMHTGDRLVQVHLVHFIGLRTFSVATHEV